MKQKKSTKMLVLTMALMATLLTGCDMNNAKDAVITIDKTVITKTQFDKEIDKASNSQMFAQAGVDLKKDPNSYMYLMVKDKIVNDLIIKSLLDNEIKARKIKVSGKEVDAELKTIIEKVGSKERFEEIIKQNGVTHAQVKKDIEQELKVQKLVAMLKPVAVSDKEVADFYKANTASFQYPEKVKASHILISANTDEIKEAILSSDAAQKLTEKQLQAKVDAELAKKMEQAKKVLAEVKKDPSQFAKIAKEKSEDTVSGKQGGDLGFFMFQDMVEPFSKAAFSMKPNTVSAVIKTVYGYHIIMVTDRSKAGVEPLEKVKGDIRTYLENQAKFATLQKFIEKAKTDANIVYNDPSFNPAEIQSQARKMSEEAQKTKKEMEKQTKK